MLTYGDLLFRVVRAVREPPRKEAAGDTVAAQDWDAVSMSFIEVRVQDKRPDGVLEFTPAMREDGS